eukprot:1252283-Rhodomonas_salina.2
MCSRLSKSSTNGSELVEPQYVRSSLPSISVSFGIDTSVSDSSLLEEESPSWRSPPRISARFGNLISSRCCRFVKYTLPPTDVRFVNTRLSAPEPDGPLWPDTVSPPLWIVSSAEKDASVNCEDPCWIVNLVHSVS